MLLPFSFFPNLDQLLDLILFLQDIILTFQNFLPSYENAFYEYLIQIGECSVTIFFSIVVVLSGGRIFIFVLIFFVLYPSVHSVVM